MNFTRVLPISDVVVVAHQKRISLLSVSAKRTNYVHNKVESGVSHTTEAWEIQKSKYTRQCEIHFIDFVVLCVGLAAATAFGKLASDKRAYFRSFSWKIKSSFCLIYLSVCIPLWRQIRGLAKKTFISHFIDDRVTQRVSILSNLTLLRIRTHQNTVFRKVTIEFKYIPGVLD